jgi:hypothetical protein
MKSNVLFSGVATCFLLAACGATGGDVASRSGGAPGSGGAQSGGSGGTVSSGGSSATGGVKGSGGVTGSGGSTVTGGTTGTGGNPGSGGRTGTGGRTTTGGTTGAGGSSAGTGGAGKGGSTGTGGNTGRDGGPGTGGAAGADAGPTPDGGANCPTTMPSGGQTCNGGNCNGQADGLGYGIWESGTGGSITYFTNAHAFSASWTASCQDFLAHVGLDFRPAKAVNNYGTIVAEFSEVKKVKTNPPWSMIGIYGWMQSPCVEWYINEDSFNNLGGKGSVTATIDGATYYLSAQQTTGTGGANACESGHTGSWLQVHSYRSSAHQCGTVSVSEHFKAWAAQGYALGNLTSVHINVEVGGGEGTIDFPLANVTAK